MRAFHIILMTAILLLFVSSVTAAQSLSHRLSEVPDTERAELLETGSVKRDRDSWRRIRLIPEHPFAEDIRDRLKDARPNVVSETLILVPRRITDTEYLELYNSLRRVSELADIEYYNPEKELYHALFTSSYRIPNPESDERLPDPIVDNIPQQDEILVRQGLPPFGDAVSRYTYVSGHNGIHFSGRNLTRITYKGFPVVGPGEMVTDFLMIRGLDYLLVYGIGGAQVFNFLGLLSGVIDNSFTSRTTGLFNWYSRNYLQPLREGELAASYPKIGHVRLACEEPVSATSR
jgi:hypothetical protein